MQTKDNKNEERIEELESLIEEFNEVGIRFHAWKYRVRRLLKDLEEEYEE